MASFDGFGEEITTTTDASAAHHLSIEHNDYGLDSYSNYSHYSSFSTAAAGGGEFTGGFPADGDVSIDHTAAASPEIYGFSDPNRNGYSEAPFGDSGHVENGSGTGQNGYGDGVFASDGPVLPPPNEMEPEDGVALREWRRQNAIHLEEKEKVEKEIRAKIIAEAEEFKVAFYEKMKVNIETKMVTNRESEKVFLASQEQFHKEADNQYWKSISELIPREIVNIEKKRSKKDQEKKPSIAVIQGPKPGKPTDLSRMRHILLKLKQTPPPHMIPPPPSHPKDNAKDGKKGNKEKSGAADSAAEGTPTSPPPTDATNATDSTPVVEETARTEDQASS